MFKQIFALSHYFGLALISARGPEKSGSDRNCINIHFNTYRAVTLIELTKVCKLRSVLVKQRGVLCAPESWVSDFAEGEL